MSESEKKAFADKIRNEISEWRARLEHLRVQASLGKMEARDRAQEIAQEIEARIHETERKLKEFEESQAENWKELSERLERIWHQVKDTASGAMSNLR